MTNETRILIERDQVMNAATADSTRTTDNVCDWLGSKVGARVETRGIGLFEVFAKIQDLPQVAERLRQALQAAG